MNYNQKKYYLTALLLLLNCGESDQEFYYAKDPTEVFYVKGQRQNFEIKENVLGTFSISAGGDVRENFSIKKAKDESLGTYTQRKNKDVSENFDVKKGANEVLGTYTQKKEEDGGETFNVTKEADLDLGYYTQKEEVIKTESVGKVDVLWNIDNSGSMSSSQKSLADNFSLFIEDFAKKDVDFKMAIITTDNSANRDTNNKLNSTELKKSKQDFIEDFEKKIQVGIRGSASEKAFEMTKSFIEGNGDWLRSDALLVIIFVSDEEEGGNEYRSDLKKQVKFYTDAIVNSKGGDVANVRAFSICSRSRCNRFKTISESTNGLVKYLDESFSDISTEFGKSIVSTLTKLETSFSLNINPSDPSKLKVDIDGSAVPKDVAETDGWNYDATANAIEFFGSHIPSNGSKIKVYVEGSIPDEVCLTKGVDADKISSLEVSVDGGTVPQDTGKSDGWNYDDTSDCIQFYGSYLPSEGSKVEIVSPGQVAKSFCLGSSVASHDMNRMTVSVDGSRVSKDTSKNDGWDYDSGKNCVEFFGSNIPGDGSKVKVYLEGLVRDKVCLSKSVDDGKINSLSVTLDGKSVPRDRGKGNGWEYDTASDCINFYGSHLPSEGSAVKVVLPGEVPKSFCLKNPIDKKNMNRVKVFLDDKAVPRDISKTNGWEMDSSAKCMELFGTHVPKEGTKIKVLLDGQAERKVCLGETISAGILDLLSVSMNNKIISRDKKRANGWDYDSNSGCLEFFGKHLPSEGAKINITIPGEVPQKVCPGSVLEGKKVSVFMDGKKVPRDVGKNNGWDFLDDLGCIGFFGNHSLRDGTAVKVSLGMGSRFCLKDKFDEDMLKNVEIVIGNKKIFRDDSQAKGWSYDKNSGCVELFGELGLNSDSFVKIVFGQTSKFCLNKPLDEEKLDMTVVSVDGIVIKRGGKGGGWDYDRKTNCLNFFGEGVPDINSKIEITYTPEYRGEL